MLTVLKNSIRTFLDDDPFTHASSLAFYTVISLPAIVIITIQTLGTAYKEDKIEETLLDQMTKYIGPSAVEQAESIIENTVLDYQSWILKIIGVAVLIFSSTTVFVSLQGGINKVWNVKPNPKLSIGKFVLDRLLSFAMIISLGFILLVSFGLDSIMYVLSNYLARYLDGLGYILAMVLNGFISFAVITIIFASIFKVLPDVKTEWKHIWVGAIFTAIMFVVGKYLIAFYISKADVGSAYGASGSLVVFLFWVYYSSVLVLFGAKFCFEYAKEDKDKIKSIEYSVFVDEKVVAKDEIDVSDD